MSKKNQTNLENEDLKAELFIVRDMLKAQERNFNQTDDENLIEALIYEQKALQSRFAFLIKQAREKGLEVNFFET
ncbi:MAG: YaaL family protein [Oscillospiraceae bacterium]|nr:YaaL family protein [Oscillospiraceae bacterium]